MSTLTTLELVRSVPLFAGLPEHQVETILSACRRTTVRAGTRVIQTSERPDALSIVVTGQVRVVDDRDGDPLTLDVLGRGAHFGETALDGSPAPFSVVAQTECELLVLPRQEFERMAALAPDIAVAMYDHRARRFDVEPDSGEVVPGATLDGRVAQARPIDGPAGTRATIGADGTVEWQRPAFVPPRRRFGTRAAAVRQSDPADSGPTALVFVCRHYGRWVRLNALRERCDTAQGDVTLEALARAAEASGFEVATLTDGTVRHVLDNALPAIVRLTARHWVAVERADNDRVVLMDPATGRRTVSASDFASHWSGEVLFLRPTAVFGALEDSRPTLAAVTQYLRPLRLVMIEVLLASVVVQVLGLGLPVFARFAVDRVMAGRDERFLLPAVGVMAGVLALALVTALTRRALVQFIAERVDAELGSDFYAHLLALPVRFFERRSVGDVVSRFEEADRLTSLLTGTGTAFVLDMVTAVLALGLMAYYSSMLMLVALVLVALELAYLLVLAPPLERSLRRLSHDSRESEGLLIESLAGLRTIKILAVEHFTRWSVEHRLIRQINTSLRGLRLRAVATAMSHLLRTASLLALLLAGAVLVLRDRITVGELVAVGLLGRRVITPFATLATVWGRMQDASQSLESINDVLETPVEAAPEAQPDQVVLHRLQGHVRFDHVTFRYSDDGAPVLHDVSFEAYAGQRIAIVGPSGSGKSTLVRLLVGFHRPSSGRVSIDGFDLADVWMPSLRSQLGVVLQDTRLFRTSIRANIGLGMPAASLHDVTAAARLANAHAWIARLPHGYETLLEENGGNLSGGQRQQMAIARALLQDRRVLVLDEATSHLDAESERVCHQNIELRFRDSTVVTVTQRLATIRRADLIVVLDRGMVVEQGDHEQLMRSGGVYAAMAARQEA